MSVITKKKCLLALVLLVAVGACAGAFAWYKFFREVPESAFANETERFKYGSVGGEKEAGLPYWIWLVLPRIFPDLLPGPGGYKAFNVVWEEGKELPVGFTKKTIGFPRVGNNCALCHVGTWRGKEDETPRLVVGAPAHSLDAQGMLRFLTRAAADPRFHSSILLPEILRETKLSFLDQQIYRFLLIPLTGKALREQGAKLTWMDRPGVPAWGHGRDDAFNLPKYFLTPLRDDSVGQCDFNSVWNMKIRKGDGLLLNWGGESSSFNSVLVDSALGVGARPGTDTDKRLVELDTYLSNLAPPKYPFPIDAALAAQGKLLYDHHCAECHEPGKPRTNRVIPLSEIGTDPERFNSWSQSAADAFNKTVAEMGFRRAPVGKQNGYYSPPLDGLWMRAPYLHNGSVPTLRDLLEPVEKRPESFYRGYDFYDPVNVGFVSQGPKAARTGWKQFASERGNGNGGHTYGVDLNPAEKLALLEYLKGL